MLERIESLPPDVLGLRANGKVTKTDYEQDVPHWRSTAPWRTLRPRS